MNVMSNPVVQRQVEQELKKLYSNIRNMVKKKSREATVRFLMEGGLLESVAKDAVARALGEVE